MGDDMISYDKRSPMLRRVEACDDWAYVERTIVDMIALIIGVFVALWILGAPMKCHAAEKWTQADTAGEVVFGGIVVTDYMQSRWFLTHDPSDLNVTSVGEWHETNPILGRHPSRAKLFGWMALSIIGHAAVSYTLPQPYRRAWQAASIVVEGTVVAGNVYLVSGLRLAF